MLSNGERWRVDCADALAWLRGLPDRAVSLVLFSPPYEGQRSYGLAFELVGQAWADWLRPIVAESCRVSSGLVIVNVAGPVRDHSYSPAVEWLVADLTRLDGLVCGPAPYAWVKAMDRDDAANGGAPGSGSKRYQRRSWEPLYAFCLPDRLPLAWSDNVAFGKPPRFREGGRMTQRLANGSRKSTGRMAKFGAAGQPAVCNPGNVIRAPVGGGHLGCSLAHEGEAPMSLGVPERFVCWFVPPGGTVADPFLGTGTTIHAAINHGRCGIGCDVRMSQCRLARKRLSLVTPGLFA